MTLRSFFHYVELRTKAASVMPFLFGILYAVWAFGQFNPINTLLMLLSLLCIDMATTASNHYVDYQRAVKKDGYNYETHNTLARDNLSLRTALNVIVALVGAGILVGLALVLRTDWLVLLIGAASFFMGLLYSWGPLPLSRSPFSEGVSGLFMGFVIVFLTVYIQLPDPNWIHIGLNGPRLLLDLDWSICLQLLMVSSPLIFGISNIMLSNNLSDREEDIINGRLTLPILIGPKWGLRLSKALYTAMFLGAFLCLLTKWVPVYCSLVFLAIPYVFKAFILFSTHPSKADTFVLSVKSFMLVAALYCLGTGIGIWVTKM